MRPIATCFLFVLLATVSCGIASSEENAVPRLPQTEAEYNEAWVKTCLRGSTHFVKLHQLVDDEAVAFEQLFERVIRLQLGRGDVAQWQQIIKQLDALSTPKIKQDPFYRLMLVMAHTGQKHYQEIVSNAAAHLASFENSDYPQFFTVLTHLRYFEAGHFLSRPSRNQARTHFSGAMKSWFQTDFRLAPEDHRFVWKMVRDFVETQSHNKKGRLFQLLKTIIDTESAPEWVRQMAQGMEYDLKAWQLRGFGFVQEVNPQVWPEFNRLTKKAAEQFLLALETNPDFPEAAVELIEIARVGGTEEGPEFWFNRSRDIQFDFLPAYQKRMAGLLPRWGGSTKELLDFGLECYRTERFETIVPNVLFEARYLVKKRAMDFRRGDPAAVAFFNSIEFKLALADCASRLVDENKSLTLSETHLLTTKALYNIGAGEFEIGLEAFKKLDGRIDPYAFTAYNVSLSPEVIIGFAKALISDRSEQAKQVFLTLSSLDPNQFAKTIEVSNGVLNGELPDSERVFFEALNQRAKVQVEYLRGKKVNISFKEGLPNWFGEMTRSERAGEFSLQLTNEFDNVHVSTFFQYKLPGPKTIEVEISPEASLGKRPQSNSWGFLPGLMMGKNYIITWDRHYNSVFFGREDIVPMLKRDLRLGKEKPKSIRLKANVYPGYLEIFVNDCFVLRSRPRSFSVTDGLGLVHSPSHEGSGKVIFSNITIKQLRHPAPPADDGSNRLERYYSIRIQQNDLDPWPYTWRGLIRHRAGNYEGCIADLKAALTKGGEVGLAGFYIGNALEHLGKTEEAIGWYQRVVETKGLTMNRPSAYNQTSERIPKHVYENALYALQWLHLGRPDLFDSPCDVSKLLPLSPNLGPWVAHRGQAQIDAANGDFKKAIERLRTRLTEVPKDYADDVQSQVKAYENGQIYTFGDSSDFHFTQPILPAYFPVLDDSLNEHWKKNLYR